MKEKLIRNSWLAFENIWGEKLVDNLGKPFALTLVSLLSLSAFDLKDIGVDTLNVVWWTKCIRFPSKRHDSEEDSASRTILFQRASFFQLHCSESSRPNESPLSLHFTSISSAFLKRASVFHCSLMFFLLPTCTLSTKKWQRGYDKGGLVVISKVMGYYSVSSFHQLRSMSRKRIKTYILK